MNRKFVGGVAACALVAVATLAQIAFAQTAAPERVLRVGMALVAETLDPARMNNGASADVVAAIFDTLYTLDPLASPTTAVPLAAAAMPDISSDYRVYTIRLRRGIRFTDDPAFGGKPRELVADDYAYSVRRLADPRIASPNHYLIDGKIAGLDALAARAREELRGLDYAAPVEGLRVIDRYTLQITLATPDPGFTFVLANPAFAAVPREVVEAHGVEFGQHPVGTGAFVLASFTPGDRIVLVRNPRYREMHFDDLLVASSKATNAAHPARGMRLPGADRIDIRSIAEPSTAVLAVRKGELDVVYASIPQGVMQGERLKPEVAADHVAIAGWATPDILYLFVNMRDPALGGLARDRIALRRAIFMAIDDEAYSRAFTDGRARIIEQIVPRGAPGYIAGYRYPNRYDIASANALLDRVGFGKGRGGRRRNPDGSTLTVRMLAGTTAEERRVTEFMKRQMDMIGVSIEFEAANLTEKMQRMNQCRFGMVASDWSLDIPDGLNAMVLFYSKAGGGANISCFADVAFDADYEAAAREPPGPKRDALFRSMEARVDALAPARPMPSEPADFLKRDNVVGPFGTLLDGLQFWTLSIAPPRSAAH
jgi:oligopeptide transport system substrate-binding protein